MDNNRNSLYEFNIALKDGSKMNRLGLGTWCMGESTAIRSQEVEALQAGIDCGMTLIDTAEMYGSGKSESLIKEAIEHLDRSSLFLVSKVYPHNAGRDQIFKSCEASRKRLGVDYLDLYLLHWRGRIPLKETVACMEELAASGSIRRWGVSNFDVDDMEELLKIRNGENCAVNQVLYHLGSRGIEYRLLPFLQEQGIRVMAYSPLAQAGTLQRKLLNSKALSTVAKKYDASAMQILLAFVLHNRDIIAIPKSGKKEHVRKNAQAARIHLEEEDIYLLSSEFPPPLGKEPLDIC